MGSTEDDVRLNPFKSSEAPLLIVVVPPDVPRGPELEVLDSPNLITPLLMVVAPVKVLFPPSFQVPVPSLVSVPALVLTGHMSVPPMVPSSVNANAPVMAPVLVKLMDPVSPSMEDAAPKVRVPG